MTAEACTVPIDVTKVRLQIQQSTKGAVFKYRGMLHAGFTIAKEEGLTALYKGLAPALFRQASYAGLRMAIYERARVLVIRDGPPAMWEKVLAGGSAGALAAAITTPTDVVKVRLQAEGKLPPGVKPRYRGTFHAFYTIAKEEGLRGLYRGVVPNVQRAAVINAAELSSYDQVKQILIKQTRYTGGDTFWSHLGASLIAGLVGTILANPIDVLKTRIMNQKPGIRSRLLLD